MKNSIFTIGSFLCLSTNLLLGQVSVDVKTIDLSANGKTKASRLVTSTFDNDKKEARLTFVKTYCDGDETKGYNERTFEARGIAYNFEHLTFDNEYNFKNLEKEKIEGLQNALFKYPVLGKNIALKSNYGYVTGANAKGQWLTQYEFAVKTYVSTKYNQFYCDQKLVTQKEGLKIQLPAESVLYTNSTTDGVMVLTQNSKSETTVNVRFFDHDGNKKAESSFMFNYGFAATGLVLKNEKGGEDIILVAQPTKKFNKYGIKIEQVKSNPLEFEYIRLDGVTMQIKDRFTFNALSTQWFPEQAVEKDGAVFLLGPASSKVEATNYYYGTFATIEGLDFPGYTRIDKLDNFQFMKVKGGKAEFVSSYTPDEMSKIQSLVPGAKGGNKPSGYFRIQEIKIVDGKIYISGQNTSPAKDGDDRKQEFLMMINEAGKLTNLHYVPKSNYANSNMFFSPDKKSMYWAIYDYSDYSVSATRLDPIQIKIGFVSGGNDHTILGKTYNDDGPQLQIVKFDLSTNSAGNLETFGKDEYTLFDNSPILYQSNSEVVFLGVAGKSKERVTKFVRLKL